VRSKLLRPAAFYLCPSFTLRRRICPLERKWKCKLVLRNTRTCPLWRNSRIVHEYCPQGKYCSRTVWWVSHQWRKWTRNPIWVHPPIDLKNTPTEHKAMIWPGFPSLRTGRKDTGDFSWGAERPVGEKSQKSKLFGGMIVFVIVLWWLQGWKGMCIHLWVSESSDRWLQV